MTWALIVGLTAWSIGKYNENKRQKEMDKAYTERESQKPTSTEWIFYQQETNELISALQLDSLGKKEYEQAIIDLFNLYVWNHINDWLTNSQLIQWFWKEYGWVLVTDFWLRHSPYDFMKESTIRNTQNVWEELSYIPTCKVGDKRIKSRPSYPDYYENGIQVVKMSNLNDAIITPYVVYLWNWEVYYVITIPTESWEYIWLASDTIDWHYTTTTFNSISETFANARFLS